MKQPRLQSLLAYLLLHRFTPQARQHVAFTFWPDSSEAQALTNLRKQLLFIVEMVRAELGSRNERQAANGGQPRPRRQDVAVRRGASPGRLYASDPAARGAAFDVSRMSLASVTRWAPR